MTFVARTGRTSVAVMAKADLSDALRQISVPTLLICGQVDARSPLTVAHQLEQAIPRAAFDGRWPDGTLLDDTTEHLTALTSRSENVCMVGRRVPVGVLLRGSAWTVASEPVVR
jgi:hypothetical protein